MITCEIVRINKKVFALQKQSSPISDSQEECWHYQNWRNTHSATFVRHSLSRSRRRTVSIAEISWLVVRKLTARQCSLGHKNIKTTLRYVHLSEERTIARSPLDVYHEADIIICYKLSCTSNFEKFD